MKEYILSKNLNITKCKDDYAIYHTYYGNLTLLNDKAYSIFNEFKYGNNKFDVASKYNLDMKEFDKNFELLIDNYFLIEKEEDELTELYKDIEYRKNNYSTGYLLKGLQLVVSNECNFKCKYCFVHKMQSSKERKEIQNSKNKLMSYDVAKKAVDNLIDIIKKNNNTDLSIEFFGGEPLTNWEVVKGVLKNYGNGEKNNINLNYSITTNGSLITEEMARLFKKYNVTIAISFDSPNNTERIHKNGTNILELIEPKLKILNEYDNCIALNSVISKETIKSYDGRALVDFAKKYNIRMLGLILDLDANFYDDNNIDKLVNILWDTYQYAKEEGIPVTGYWHQIFKQITGMQPNIIISGYKTCPATGCKLSVEPEGQVFICKCCSNYIGEIDDLNNILTSNIYKEYAMRAYVNDIKCKNCEIEGFCSGVCMGALEIKKNSLYGIEPALCSVYKNITKKLIENINKNEIEKIYL